jgi:hypothetical protein
LPEKLLADFDNLTNHTMCQVMDGDIAQAKLDGSWPGWEWLPAIIKAKNRTLARQELRNKTMLDVRSND